MPSIYLSPSTQEYNLYYDGAGSEEYYMNLIADAMEPYLTASGIVFTRNTPDMTAASSIRASNAGNYDAHVALHSNAAPESLSGRLRGIDIYYYPGSERSHRLADDMVAQLRAIYPLPDRVRAQSTTAIGEVRRVRAPSVFLELAFHDNEADASWIKNNLDAVARSIVLYLTESFGIPIYESSQPREGRKDVSWGVLNIRARPEMGAPILAQAPDGASLTILNGSNGWYLVNYNGTVGYASDDFVTVG